MCKRVRAWAHTSLLVCTSMACIACVACTHYSAAVYICFSFCYEFFLCGRQCLGYSSEWDKEGERC